MPRSLVESNGMLSCRGAANNSIDVGRIFTLLPLDDCWTVQEAPSETVLDKQLMQFSQGRDRYPRHPQLHSGTCRGIEHPCRYDQDVAGSHLDVNDVPAGAPLDILSSNPAPIQRVPAVMNLNFLPDMGRMTA
jgi:hypothetical protein